MLLGGVGQSWLCGVIAEGLWKGQEKEVADGFGAELWFGGGQGSREMDNIHVQRKVSGSPGP